MAMTCWSQSQHLYMDSAALDCSLACTPHTCAFLLPFYVSYCLSPSSLNYFDSESASNGVSARCDRLPRVLPEISSACLSLIVSTFSDTWRKGMTATPSIMAALCLCSYGLWYAVLWRLRRISPYRRIIPDCPRKGG